MQKSTNKNVRDKRVEDELYRSDVTDSLSLKLITQKVAGMVEKFNAVYERGRHIDLTFDVVNLTHDAAK